MRTVASFNAQPEVLRQYDALLAVPEYVSTVSSALASVTLGCAQLIFLVRKNKHQSPEQGPHQASNPSPAQPCTLQPPFPRTPARQSAYAIALYYGWTRVRLGAYTGGQVMNVLFATLMGG